jgi:hypothetical protein
MRVTAGPQPKATTPNDTPTTRQGERTHPQIAIAWKATTPRAVGPLYVVAHVLDLKKWFPVVPNFTYTLNHLLYFFEGVHIPLTKSKGG